MTEVARDIDEIVRAVMRRLALTPGIDGPLPAPVSGELRITAPVVSLAALESRLAERTASYTDRRPPSPRTAGPLALGRRLAGVRQVTVGTGAVVTPAVRDLLKQHRIAIVMGACPTTTVGGPAALAVAVVGTACDPAELSAQRAGEEPIVRIAATNLVGAVDEMAGRVRSGGWLGLLVTDQAAVALCLANRQRGVRAAEVTTVAGVAAAAAAVGANLVIVSPVCTDRLQISAIASALRQQGIQPCPEPFQARLAE